MPDIYITGSNTITSSIITYHALLTLLSDAMPLQAYTPVQPDPIHHCANDRATPSQSSCHHENPNSHNVNSADQNTSNADIHPAYHFGILRTNADDIVNLDDTSVRASIIASFYQCKHAEPINQVNMHLFANQASIERQTKHDIHHSHQATVLTLGVLEEPQHNPQIFTQNLAISADIQSVVLLTVEAKNTDITTLWHTIVASYHAAQHTVARIGAIILVDCTEEQLSELQALQAYKDNIMPLPIIGLHNESDDHWKFSISREALIELIDTASRNMPTTPLNFQYSLLTFAKQHHARLILPEADDDRVLQAADYLLERNIVDLILLGEQSTILERASELNLHSIQRATFQSMHDESLINEMIALLCTLRANKGMTPELARTTLNDSAYFATMMVMLERADGFVSGAIHSTSNTVRPALQIIKTKPHTSAVSGSFIVCLPDRVTVFADCAINTNPTAETLVDIAIQSAKTLEQFGIEPRIGMLSYSTLGSGKGVDVDLVTEATELLHEKAPELSAVGPIQFDAAWSPTVAQVKAPNNPVAGHVNVFVFPDLSAGNIGYKAVQRAGNATAIGPILQGLRKPVNDLSRGSTVQDIINTIALTAITTEYHS